MTRRLGVTPGFRWRAGEFEPPEEPEPGPSLDFILAGADQYLSAGQVAGVDQALVWRLPITEPNPSVPSLPNLYIAPDSTNLLKYIQPAPGMALVAGGIKLPPTKAPPAGAILVEASGGRYLSPGSGQVLVWSL